MNVEASDIRALRGAGRHEEALQLAVKLVRSRPQDAECAYEAACVNDFLGHEEVAAGLYTIALTGPLSDEQERGAFLGLGSTYRVLGEFQKSVDVLDRGLTRFPEAPELRAFRAITLYNLGRSAEAVSCLLGLVAETSADPQISRLRPALRLYARELG